MKLSAGRATGRTVPPPAAAAGAAPPAAGSPVGGDPFAIVAAFEIAGGAAAAGGGANGAPNGLPGSGLPLSIVAASGSTARLETGPDA
jgi:hypothetical protein